MTTLDKGVDEDDDVTGEEEISNLASPEDHTGGRPLDGGGHAHREVEELQGSVEAPP